MKCLDESIIMSFYDHELESGFEKVIEEHAMACQKCWVRIIKYNSSNRNLEMAQDAVEPALLDETVKELHQYKEESVGLPKHQIAEKVFA